MKKAPTSGLILNLSLNLSLFLLASCADVGEHSSTTLVFKHGKLTGDPRVMQGLLHEFEREHPGVTVREEVLPASTDQQHQYYAINLDSRQVAFDVLAVDVIWVSEFARAGWIRSVDTLVPPADRHDYFESALEAATFKHKLHAIPWYIDAGVLYYRRDLLERYGFAPPRTWPELVRTARTIMDEERDPALKGFLWPGKQYEGLVCVAFEFMWGHGGSIIDTAGLRDAEAALVFMRDLIRDGISPELVSTADEEATRLLFSDGRAVFMRNWPYVWSLLQQQDSPLRGKIGVGTLPAFPGHRSASTLGGWMLAVPTHASQPQLAEAFIAFLSRPVIQQRLALELGYHPARRSLYDDPALRRTHPALNEVFPVLLTARPRPITPYYLMLSQILQPELSAVVVGRKTPEAALASVRKQMTHLGVEHEGRESGEYREKAVVPR